MGMSFLMPTFVDDLARRHAMMRVWAELSALYNVYDKEPLMDRVRAFLARADEPPSSSPHSPQPSA
jgi:hypothetical protein